MIAAATSAPGLHAELGQPHNTLHVNELIALWEVFYNFWRGADIS